MIIVAGGDSFVFGSELADCPDGRRISFSRYTFPALLADSDDKYVCAAYPGNSNDDIARELRTVLEKIPGIPFVVVCWTWPSRDKVYTSGRVIKEFQQYCEYHGLPYMFTCADNCLLDVIDKSKLNMDNWFLFPEGHLAHETPTPRGFYQWAVENKYDVGPESHPLEQAHLDASDMMRGKFNELVKKYIQQNSTRNSLS
jgi:hypothetical protein